MEPTSPSLTREHVSLDDGLIEPAIVAKAIKILEMILPGAYGIWKYTW